MRSRGLGKYYSKYYQYHLQINIQIRDSKRIMKNLKRNDIKKISRSDETLKNVPISNGKQRPHPAHNSSKAVRAVVSPEAEKIIAQFSQPHQKIISHQFMKMIKNLRKKLSSPDKMEESTKKMGEMKTQRIEIVDPYNCTKQTIKKSNNLTERKQLMKKSPEHKITQGQQVVPIKSPKKNGKKASQELIFRQSLTVSPRKIIKIKNKKDNYTHIGVDTKTIKNTCKNKGKKQKNLKEQRINKNQRQDDYLLIGESFISVDVNKLYKFKQAQDNVELEQRTQKLQRNRNKSKAENVWSQFFEQKSKITKDRINSNQSSCFGQSSGFDNYPQKLQQINFHNQFGTKPNNHLDRSIENSSKSQSIVEQLISKSGKAFTKDGICQKFNKQTTSMNLIQELEKNCIQEKQIEQKNTGSGADWLKLTKDDSFNMIKAGKNQPILNEFAMLKLKQGENQKSDVRIVTNSSIQSDQQHLKILTTPILSPKQDRDDTIKLRINAINLQLKTNKQILSKLQEGKKIDRNQYEKYMDLAMQIYDKQMTQIEKLKEMMEENEQKIDELIRVSAQIIKKTQTQEQNVSNIISCIFGSYLNEQKNIEGLNLDKEKNLEGLDKSFIFDKNSQSSVKNKANGHGNKNLKVSKGEQQGFRNKGHEDEIDSFDQFKKGLHDHSRNIKLQIQSRFLFQAGHKTNNNEKGCFTTMPNIFNFFTTFCLFIKSSHLKQFLTFVNMPYGYSVQQRLKYMQGYDDEEEQSQEKIIKNGGIVYGIEEVFRSNLLDEFFFIQQANKKISNQEKIHCKAIFDAINENINKFRPYYQINGCPYPWSCTEKALTYYFIKQDCFEELLDKVQTEIEKCASGLCGVLVQSKVTNKNKIDKDDLKIQQIFEKYTLQTEAEVLQIRQQKLIKQEKLEINQTIFEWFYYDEFKTAILYEISSCILEDLAHEVALKLCVGYDKIQEIIDLYEECGMKLGNLLT